MPSSARFALSLPVQNLRQAPLTFTYLTFTRGSVSTVTATYGIGSGVSSTGPAPTSRGWSDMSNPLSKGPSDPQLTSYVVNSADLAYPTFSSIPASIANVAAAPGLPKCYDIRSCSSRAHCVAQESQLDQLPDKQEPSCQAIAAPMQCSRKALSIIANSFCADVSAFIHSDAHLHRPPRGCRYGHRWHYSCNVYARSRWPDPVYLYVW